MHDGTNIPSNGRDSQDQLSDLDERFDEALRLTFPASDPISLQLDRDPRSNKPRGDHERELDQGQCLGRGRRIRRE
jgi:hypothetical protein